MSSDTMEKIYRVGKWIPGPGTEEGSTRYKQTLVEMRRVLDHEWCKNVKSRRGVLRIIDVCGGWGLAGIAMCKILKERGIETELSILDIRRDSGNGAEVGEKPAWRQTRLHIRRCYTTRRPWQEI
jgi:hypothetical protein